MNGMPGMMMSPPPPPPAIMMSPSPPVSSSSSNMHNHGAPNTPTMSMPMSYSHMTFFWGKNSEILFSGWPGTSSGMYALALILIFFLTILIEWLSCRQRRASSRPETRYLTKGGGGIETAGREEETNNSNMNNKVVVVGLMWTLLHTMRMGLAYIVMLAVMSFNGGVLIAVVIGHGVGFVVFSSGIFLKRLDSNQIVGVGGESCDPHH